MNLALRSSLTAVSCVVLSGCIGALVPVVRLDADSQLRLAGQVRVYKVAEKLEGRVSPLGPIAATSCKNQLTDPAATEEDAIGQLRFRSIQLGGNAVLNAVCDSEGTNLAKNCWSSVTCRGTAAQIAPVSEVIVVQAEQAKRKFDSSGTGFFVTREGSLVTNQHVVEGCGAIRVRSQGVEIGARVVASDESNDLAVLQVDATGKFAFIPLRPLPARLAEPVVALGYPLPGLLSPTVGASTGTVSALAGIQGDSRFIQISAPIQPGNSGGPLLDYRGAAVGVVVGKLNALRVARVTGDVPQNVNFAIGLRGLQTFLEARGVLYVTADGLARDLSAAAEVASAATAQVLCKANE